MGFVKITNFCSTKNGIRRMRRQVIKWDKIITKDTSNKGLLSKIYKIYKHRPNKHFHSGQVGMQNSTANLAVSYKTKHTLNIQYPPIMLFGIYPKEPKTYFYIMTCR